MTIEQRPPRRAWPWILLAAIVLIAVVLAIVLATTANRQPGTQTSAPTQASPTTVASSAPAATAPTGCLGGPARDAAMVIAAQKAALHTSNGAVEVAAAMVRWTFQSPSPSASDADEVSANVIASTASDEFKDLKGAIEKTPNNSGGAVPDGTDFHISTAPGVWHLESSSADTAKVTVGGAYVVAGALSPQLRSSTTFTLVWQAGEWKIESGSVDTTTQQLFAEGTTFTEGC